MANKPNTRVRFLGGHAPRKELLGILAYPVVLDGHDEEHTRFLMAAPPKWGKRPIDADLVSAAYEDSPQGKAWWLLGKRGDVYAIRASGLSQEQIADAGTGPGKFGYLASIKVINGRLFACGYCRQVHERTPSGWVHQDQGILLDEHATGHSLNDIAGLADGTLCAVGSKGEIALRTGAAWAMADSPTNAHLYALCTDDQGLFCAAGANGTVIRGDASGFEVLCSGGAVTDPLWDIEFCRGELVVSGSDGVFVVRDDRLVPFDTPPVPAHVGYKLSTVDDVLWSIGTHQIYCLQGAAWTEWICPDNVP